MKIESISSGLQIYILSESTDLILTLFLLINSISYSNLNFFLGCLLSIF
jgi:hypothetical protein